jgi:uncharacterized protein YjgD (DUF1641 family)
MASALEIDRASLSLEPKAAGGQNGKTVAAAAANPEAIQAANDLLDRLYETGVLDFLRALASGGSEIVNKLAEAVDQPQSIRVLRNGLALLAVLSSFDPEVLKSVLQPPPPASQDAEPPSLWSLFRRLQSAEARKGLDAIVGVLERFGGALHRTSPKP